MRRRLLALPGLPGLAAAVLAGAAAAALPSASQFEATPATAVSAVAVRHHVVFVGGKPTFLFGVWAADPHDGYTVRTVDAASAVAALGANTLVRPPGATAAAANGQAWVLVPSDPGGSLAAPLPNELGVALEDEPEAKGLTPEQLATSPGDGRLRYENFVHVGDPANAAAAYGAYLANLGPAAVVTFDDYVLNREACTRPDVGVGTVYDDVRAERRAVAAAAPSPDGVAFGAWIETGRIDGAACPAPLAPGQVAGEARAAIAGGATVVNWWTWSWLGGGPDELAVAPEVAAAIRAVTDEAHRLAPLLLAPQVAGIASGGDDPVKVGARLVDAAGGRRTLYLILVNTSGARVVATRRLPWLAGGVRRIRIRDAVAGGTYPVRDGVVTAAIAPYGWLVLGYPTSR